MNYGERKTDPLFLCKNCGEYICEGESFLELEEGRLCMECAYAISREELLEMAGIEVLEAGKETR